MNPEEILGCAMKLREAETLCKPIESIDSIYGSITMQDAYRIQQKFAEVKARDDGTDQVGWKVALTTPQLQQRFATNEPVLGILLRSGVLSDGAVIMRDRLNQPIAEAEVAFCMLASLEGPGVTTMDVIRATEFVLPAMEIADLRVRRLATEDLVADNTRAKFIVMGSKRNSLADLDLRLVGVVFEKNGKVVATGAGADVLGNPINSVVWLANKLGEMGLQISSGQIIMSGSLITPVPVEEGDSVTITFDRLGSVRAKFE